MKKKILLKSIDDVKCFVNEVSKADFDVDLSSGRYVVDAKSIMGIFSLDLTNAITMDIHCNDKSKTDSFVKSVEKFIVE